MADFSFHTLPIGSQLHGLVITAILGQGGFGITYKAHDPRLNRYVVVKEYMPQSLASRLANKTVSPNSSEMADHFRYGLASFLKEAQTLGHFQHPNIVPVLDFFEANNTAYIVMPYLEGETLEEKLNKNGTMNLEEVKQWLFPLLDGLQTIHAEGFLHRDIKPGNIYLRGNGQPVLIDFGAARNALANRSHSMSVVLTQGYAPMEQYSRNAANQGPWSDIYALGGVLYRCVTGNEPIDSTERHDAILNGGSDPLQPGFDRISGAVNPAFASIVAQCMRIARKDRIQGVAELRLLLHNQSSSNKSQDKEEIVLTECIDQPKGQTWEKLSAKKQQNTSVPEKSDNSNKLKYTFIALGLICLLACTWFYFKKENIPDGIDGVIMLAERGNAEAQTRLGYAYATGDGIEKNKIEAVKWFRKAAEQGDVKAQFNLGNCYREERGIVKNETEAAKWFRKAADNGFAPAQFNLGVCYMKGVGVNKNLTKAVYWYRRAAAQGFDCAHNTLLEFVSNKCVE